MFQFLTDIFTSPQKQQKLLTEQRLRARRYQGRYKNLTEWSNLAARWGLADDTELSTTLSRVNQWLLESEHLLKRKKTRLARLQLDQAGAALDDPAFQSRLGEQLKRYTVRMARLLLVAKDIATEVCQIAHRRSLDTLLMSCTKLCRKANRDRTLADILKTSHRAIEILDRLVNEMQSAIDQNDASGTIPEILARIRQQLRETGQKDALCKEILMKELSMMFNINRARNHQDFRLAILCEASALDQHFSALVGNTVKSSKEIVPKAAGDADSAALWRLSVSRGVIFYIVGVTPKHFQSKREWYKVIKDFSAIIVFLEDFSAPSDEEAEAILSALMLFPQGHILLAGPARDAADKIDKNRQFFLLNFMGNIKLLPDSSQDD